jgi:hypothetical protein
MRSLARMPDRGVPQRMTRRRFLTLAGMLGVALVGRPVAAHTGDPSHGGYTDALIHEAMDDLNAWIGWLGANKGYIGEFGVPSNLGQRREQFYPDQEQWRELGEVYFARLDGAKLWATMHDCSERQLWGGYYASLYIPNGDQETRAISRAISRPTYQATLLESHASTPDYLRGLHFTGGDEFDESVNSNANPGVFDKDYWYPGIARDPETGLNTFEYLATRGIGVVRLPFRWERIQPTLRDLLSSTELRRYKASVASAAAAGIKVVIDCHNYGGYCTSSGRQALNTPALPTVAFVDLWSRLSTHFQNDPNVVAYDLMNEPYNHGGIDRGSYATAEEAWEAITQRVVNQIRNKGDTKKIMVPTYANVQRTPRKHRKPWIVNGGDFMYTSHHYFDQYTGSGTGGGDYARSYDEEVAISTGEGY